MTTAWANAICPVTAPAAIIMSVAALIQNLQADQHADKVSRRQQAVKANYQDEDHAYPAGAKQLDGFLRHALLL